MNSFLFKHGGNVNEESRRLRVPRKQLLDASASIVPFPPPNSLNDCLIETLNDDSLQNYPDLTHHCLKKAIGNFHQVDLSMVLPGNGAAELFTWAAKDSAQAGSSAIPSPCFSDYERALRCWDASFIYMPFPLTWSKSFPQPFPLEPKTKSIWITNPHNPTGQLWSKNSLKKLLDSNTLVICDEAFLPLTPNGEKESLLPLTNQYKNLIVIRSLTKLFALPGLRIGYAISHPDRLKKWQDWRDPWPLNCFAIAAGTTLMSKRNDLNDWINRIQKWVSVEGNWLHLQLTNMPGIIAHPSSTNFQLIESKTSLLNLRENMSRKGILLRDCSSFKSLGENWLRISLQAREGNKKIIRSLGELLK